MGGGGIKYFWYFHFFFKLSFKIPLLIPSPRVALIYERFVKLAFNIQGGDSYLNELVYAIRWLVFSKRWQFMSKVFVQRFYSLGNFLPVGLVKLECAANETINCRAVSEVNIFEKRF